MTGTFFLEIFVDASICRCLSALFICINIFTITLIRKKQCLLILQPCGWNGWRMSKHCFSIIKASNIPLKCICTPVTIPHTSTTRQRHSFSPRRQHTRTRDSTPNTTQHNILESVFVSVAGLGFACTKRWADFGRVLHSIHPTNTHRHTNTHTIQPGCVWQTERSGN